MKSTVFALLLLAVLVPRASSAGPIRDVDNSDYGIQPGSSCTVSNSTAFSPSCTFTDFSGPTGFLWGFLVAFDSPVNDVEVTFSNVTILDYGLEECRSSAASGDAFNCVDRGSTPALNLDDYPASILSQFSMPFVPALGVPGSSVVFDLNGAIAATSDLKHQVAFLLLCSPDAGGAPADAGCDGAGITVSSLAATTAPVPEPGSLLLCGSGAAMLARRVRNRRARV